MTTESRPEATRNELDLHENQTQLLVEIRGQNERIISLLSEMNQNMRTLAQTAKQVRVTNFDMPVVDIAGFWIKAVFGALLASPVLLVVWLVLLFAGAVLQALLGVLLRR